MDVEKSKMTVNSESSPPNSRIWLFDRKHYVLFGDIDDALNMRRLPLHDRLCLFTLRVSHEDQILVDADRVILACGGYLFIFSPGSFTRPKLILIPGVCQPQRRRKVGLTGNDGEIYVYLGGRVFRIDGSHLNLTLNCHREISSLCVIEDSSTRFRCAFTCDSSKDLFSATVTECAEPRFERNADFSSSPAPRVIGHYGEKVYLCFSESSAIAVVAGGNRPRIIFELREIYEQNPSVAMLGKKIYVRVKDVYIINVDTETVERIDCSKFHIDSDLQNSHFIKQYSIRKRRFGASREFHEQ